ncbi:hypothetical protein [Spirosoma utsteinense]|uniref:Uncharacterized protein n=1 Tax=Spirosoma utsteinense TaxID=2585773 RepID=A0ABR6W2R0_9BACT|nr:hypothetical protein [Spirosoma utsteinense]MBC3784368.1 hypothetical protein [Spirosoma utsteinense]MBC3790833.1 hypothetical protein [Spirosoma utsteinense]
MSKTLRYTLIGEGFAEYQFIPAYMSWAAGQAGDLKAIRTNIQIAVSKNPSVSKVLDRAAMYCAQSFTDDRNPCDLFIAGIDLDGTDFTDDLEIHDKRLRELKEKMGKVYRQYEDRTILYVPIQAIDCWVYYTQHQASANSLEAVGKDDTKKKVYGDKNPDRQRIEKVVRESAAKADFSKLAKQSRSFAHFHKQVSEFLTTYNKT